MGQRFDNLVTTSPGNPTSLALMSDPGHARSAHDAAQGPALLAVSLTTFALAVAASVMRYLSIRRLNRGVLEWEDRILGLALTLGIITTIFNGVEGIYHDKRQATLQVDYLTQPWLIMSTAAAKISITIMLLRVAADLKAWRIMFMIQAAVVFIFSTMACFVIALQCRPMQKLWRPEVEGVCLSPHAQHDLEHVQGAFDILTTMCIAFAAALAPLVQSVRQGRPWGFYTLALVSTLIFVLAIVRTYMVSLFNPEEQPYTTRITGTIFAVLEQNLGIASASIVPIFTYFEATRAARDEEAANLDASSTFSRKTFASKLSKLSSRRNSTGSTIVIQGPSRESYDPTTAAAQLRTPNGGEFLPLGIIKTVSVKVISEEPAHAENGLDAGSSRPGTAQSALSANRPGTAQSAHDASRPGSRRGQDYQHWLDQQWLDTSRPGSRRSLDQ